MKSAVVVAVIAAFPPTLAAVLVYLANSRSLRRTVGESDGLPLARVVERLDEKLDQVKEALGDVSERVAHLEGASVLPMRIYRNVERVSASLRDLAERVARVEARRS